jgi:hypothetical protein
MTGRWASGNAVFRYRLDFYYQQAIIYLLTFIAYVAVRGMSTTLKLVAIIRDPFVYIIGFFAVSSLVVLVLNIIRARRLVVTDDALLFQHRFRERAIPVSEMEWISLGREFRVQTGGRNQRVFLKVKERPGVVRIRTGRYEHSTELLRMITALTTPVRQATSAEVRQARRLV